MKHLFSKLRQCGGFNCNPSVRMIRLSLRHIFSTEYIQTNDKDNVQCLKSETLINESSQLIKRVEKCMYNFPTDYDDDYEAEFMEDTQLLDDYIKKKNRKYTITWILDFGFVMKILSHISLDLWHVEVLQKLIVRIVATK